MKKLPELSIKLFGTPLSSPAPSMPQAPMVNETDVMLRNVRTLPPDPDSVILLVDQIEVRQQVREHFDPEALQELAADIAEHGQHQPVVVTHLHGSRYLLEAGERRLRAIRDVLKRDEIRASIRRPQDNEAEFTRELVQLSENEQRENLTKLEVARAIVNLQGKTGWTDGEVAERMHRSRSWVVRVRGLLDAPEVVQQAIVDGTISWHAWTRNREAVLAAAATLSVSDGAEQLGDAYEASQLEQDTGTSNNVDEAASGSTETQTKKEPTISLPWGVALNILRNMQKIAAAHDIEFEVPKKPARKELPDLLQSLNRKISKVV
jgi:ParB/RepB/Spo0J family partition protein